MKPLLAALFIMLAACNSKTSIKKDLQDAQDSLNATLRRHKDIQAKREAANNSQDFKSYVLLRGALDSIGKIEEKLRLRIDSLNSLLK